MALDFSTKIRIKKASGLAFVVAFAAGGLYFYYAGFKKIMPTNNNVVQSESVAPITTKEDLFVGNSSGFAPDKSKSDALADIPLSAMSKSENYRMKEIAFGGYEASASGETKNVPLQIANVRSEVLASRDGKDAKLLISWKTNKLAKSDIIYSKGGTDTRILSEEGPGMSHALVIGKFDFATRYTYSIKATDLYGGTAKSEDFVAYAGKKNDSVVELIVSEFKKMFSWAKV